MTRQKVLETFINDKVEKINNSVYFWRVGYYEIIPYKQILKDQTLKASHFVKYEAGGILYGIRELSLKVKEKRYPIDLIADSVVK